MTNIPEKEQNSVIAIFSQHSDAESALKALNQAGLDLKQLVIMGQQVGSNDLRTELDYLDISEGRLVRLETAINTGKSALIVHGTVDQTDEAFELLQNSGAEEVRLHRPPGETTRHVA